MKPSGDKQHNRRILPVGVGVSELWASDLGSFEASSAVHLWPSLYSFIVFTEGHLLPRVLLASSASFSSDTVGSSDLYLGLSRFCSCFCTSTDLRHLPFAICILSRSASYCINSILSSLVLLVTLQSIMMTPFFNMMIKLSLGVERLFGFHFLTRLLVVCSFPWLPLATTILPCTMSWSSQNSSLHDAVPSIGFHSCSQMFQMGVSWGSLLSCHTRTLTLTWSFSQLS